MSQDATYTAQELSPDEALASLYRLAMSVAAENGAIITTGARGLGPYAFMAEVRRRGIVIRFLDAATSDRVD
ncbi:hypothetical protein DT019_30110 [Streptomyces sp. SDr-06]|uniref:hypothetical protein n=1 Tax=Streptomyces sp. SDr-06 TaxID=2267702 RepID=UPI000DE90754|nr:hypothetical protein [Streptomyces sp. SDr-06]RCH65125.1 hypothetical protein DT019_30110 [Streptomyces sp. SDr-06]